MKFNLANKIMALHTAAISAEFDFTSAKSLVQSSSNVSIVDVRGPLTLHKDGFFDSYDSIFERIQIACNGSSETIVMKIDSPGGDATGCFELCANIRDAVTKSGKKLIAFVEGYSASAAYAISCAADLIYATPSSVIGSIGCIQVIAEQSVRNASEGLNFSLFISGDRKADGNPNFPVSDGAAAATQQSVNEMADLFYEVVSERRKLSSDTIKGLQAGVFLGTTAKQLGLIDGVYTSLDAALSSDTGEKPVNKAELMAALEALAEGDGEDKEWATNAMKKMAVEEEDESPPEKEATKANSSESKDDEEKKDDKTEAKAVAALLSTRPDIDKAQRAFLATMPYSTVLAAFSVIPAPAPKATSKAALAKPAIPSASIKPTSGSNGKLDESNLPVPNSDEEIVQRSIDIKLGKIQPNKAAFSMQGSKHVSRLLTPEEARAELNRRNSK